MFWRPHGEDFREGEVVLRCVPLSIGVFGSHKKRICAQCFRDNGRRLETCCEGCSQVFYCDEACRSVRSPYSLLLPFSLSLHFRSEKLGDQEQYGRSAQMMEKKSEQ